MEHRLALFSRANQMVKRTGCELDHSQLTIIIDCLSIVSTSIGYSKLLAFFSLTLMMFIYLNHWLSFHIKESRLLKGIPNKRIDLHYLWSSSSRQQNSTSSKHFHFRYISIEARRENYTNFTFIKMIMIKYERNDFMKPSEDLVSLRPLTRTAWNRSFQWISFSFSCES